MIKILSFISFCIIEELPFVSLNEKKTNAITVAGNVHSADNSSTEPAVLQGTNCLYLFFNVLGSFGSA